MSPETALVVDDEPLVRHLVRRILEPEVCRVVEADDGETALRLIQRQAQLIDVVVTDLVMPGIDGFDVAEVLATHLPTLPVLCMSGYVDPHNADRRVTAPFIQKPFTAEALLEAVTGLLESSRAARASAQATRQRTVESRAASEALRSRSEVVRAASVDLVAAARALMAARAKSGGAG